MAEAKNFAECYYKSLRFSAEGNVIQLVPSTQIATSSFDGEPHPEYLPETYKEYAVASKNYSHDDMKKITDNIFDTLYKWKLATTIHLSGSDFYMVILDNAERLKALDKLIVLTVRVELSSYHTFNPADILSKLPQLHRFEVIAGDGISLDDLKREYDVKDIPSGFVRVQDKDVEGNESKLVFENVEKK